SLSANRSTEYEWSLKAAATNPLDTTYAFRVTNNGTALTTYSQCATLTTKLSVPPPTAVVWAQTNFRFRDDDGGEISATGWGPENVGENENVIIRRTEELGDGKMRLRIALTAQQDDGGILPRLEFKVTSQAEGCGGVEADWRIARTEGNIFIIKNSSNFDDQTLTTQQVSHGAGFVPGLMLDSTNPAPLNFLLKNQKTEYEWSLEDVYGFTRGVIYTFRITNDGTPLPAYTICPQAVFTPPDYQPQVPPTRINFSGRAWPEARITIIEKSHDAMRLMKQETVTADDGAFDIIFEGVIQSQYTYGVIIADEDGRTTQTKTYPIDTASNSLTVKEILASPIVAFTRPAVTRGDFIKIIGFASPKNKVKIEVDGDVTYETAADERGKYSLLLNTARLPFGRHSVRAKQKDAATAKESDFSPTTFFSVSASILPKADFNGDGRIDVRDWGVFLARWKDRDKEETRLMLDLNGDGKVDLSDFGAFLRAFKR
ncbi:MAG: EF-hand domain-containing protein, partial [Candidatus Sungiibacteriota bacterium]